LFALAEYLSTRLPLPVRAECSPVRVLPVGHRPADTYAYVPPTVTHGEIAAVGEPCPSPYSSPRQSGFPRPQNCLASQNSCPLQYFCVSTVRGNYCCGLPQQVTNPPVSDRECTRSTLIGRRCSARMSARDDVHSVRAHDAAALVHGRVRLSAGRHLPEQQQAGQRRDLLPIHERLTRYRTPTVHLQYTPLLIR